MNVKPRHLIAFSAIAVAVAGILLAAVRLPFVSRLTADGSVDLARVSRGIVAWCVLVLAAVWIAYAVMRRPRQVLLACVSVALASLVAEMLLRLTVPRSLAEFHSFRSSRYHHVLPSSTAMYMGEYEGEHAIFYTNEDGLRTTYSRDEFLSHGVRIAALGDSFTAGLGIRQDRTWPMKLEAELRSRLGSDDIAVLNSGRISYSPFLQWLQYEGIVRHYRPQLVVLGLDTGDIANDYTYRKEARGEPPAEARFAWGDGEPLPYHGAIWRLTEKWRDGLRFPIEFVWRRLARRLSFIAEGDASPSYDYYDFSIEVDGVTDTNHFFIYRYPLDSTRPYFDATHSNLCGIAESCHSDSADLLVVPFPRFHHWNTNECPDNWEADAYALDEPHQFVYFDYFEDIRPNAPFDVFSILPHFQHTDAFPLVLRDDPHWNERGHAFVARVMAPYLTNAFRHVFAPVR
mgnify:CR=1 FL=1